MRDLSRGARVPGAIALMLLACGVTGQGAHDAAVPQQAIASPQMPYSAVGYVEESGVRMAVLAHGDLTLLRKRGDDVGSDFRLVVVDPPALLHLPTGTVLQVRRHGEGPINARTSQSVAPLEATSPAEFETALARVLAAP